MKIAGSNVRIFGEMVNILCEQGETDAAAALEELWNDLGRRKRVFDALRLPPRRLRQASTLPTSAATAAGRNAWVGTGGRGRALIATLSNLPFPDSFHRKRLSGP